MPTSRGRSRHGRLRSVSDETYNVADEPRPKPTTLPTSRGRRRRRLRPPEVSDETFGRLRTLPRFLRSKVDEPAAAAAMRSVSDENTKCAGRRPPWEA